MNPYLKKVVANTSWLASEKVVAMMINLIVSLVLARSLGPERFGTLNYLLAIIAIVKPLAALGLNGIVSRELINTPALESKIIVTVMGLRFFGALLGCLICIGVAWASWGISSVPEGIGLVVLAISSCFSAFSVLEFWFQAHMAAKVVARMRTIVIAVFGLLKVISLYLYDDLLLVLIIYSVENVLLGLGFVWIYSKRSDPLKINFFDVRYGLGLLKQSSWLLLSSVAAVIYLKIDQVMLEHLASSKEVGVYAVAARLSEVWYFFADALVISLFPALLRLRGTFPDLYQKRLQQACDALLLAALCLSVLVTITGRPIVVFFYGAEYFDSAVILQIHIWASVFVFMRAVASKWLLAENLLAFSLVSHGLGAAINIIGNWLLIPQYGGVGAAVSTVISYGMASYAAFWVGASTRPIACIMTRSILLPITLGYRYWRSEILRM